MLLVHGAAGGVGTLAVQFALARGARVIGTASAAGLTHLTGLGAAGTIYGAAWPSGYAPARRRSGTRPWTPPEPAASRASRGGAGAPITVLERRR
ncbi:hypothetical protein SCALM49S_05282 [Streptomyces californicus]